jgi:hypothetical protein
MFYRVSTYSGSRFDEGGPWDVSRVDGVEAVIHAVAGKPHDCGDISWKTI